MKINDSEHPFDAFRALLAQMPAASADAVAAVRARDAQLTKPPGALGRLEEIVEWLAAWQDRAEPTVDRPTVVVFAANHGVVAQGVSPYPASVTAQMLKNFSSGGAAVNQICAVNGAGLKVFELALNLPTRDITEAPAMEARECAATIAYGMEAIAGGADVLALGEMGIGNTTIAAAIYHALYGGAAEDWVGRGTGVNDEGLKRKADAVRRAVALHRDHLDDPFEVLRRLGGREDRRHGRRHSGGAHGADPGAARRLCGLRGGGDPACASIPRASTIASPAMSRPKPPTPKFWSGSARSRCSISACGSAKAPARRWRSASSRRRSPATRTWRPSNSAGVDNKDA